MFLNTKKSFGQPYVMNLFSVILVIKSKMLKSPNLKKEIFTNSSLTALLIKVNAKLFLRYLKFSESMTKYFMQLKQNYVSSLNSCNVTNLATKQKRYNQNKIEKNEYFSLNANNNIKLFLLKVN